MTLHGVDISAWQPNFSRYDLVDFAIVKISEGTYYPNSQQLTIARTQANNTLRAGKKLGLYHFMTAENVEAQAKAFVSYAKPYIGKAMLVLDWEANALPLGAKAALQWLKKVEELTGIKPVIYMSLSVENAYNWNPVVNNNNGLWVAQYNSNNTINGFKQPALYGKVIHWPNITIHQYTSSGRLPGEVGNLDFNNFFGNAKAWDAYVKGKGHVNVTKPIPAPSAEPPKGSWVDALGVTWKKEKGTFTLNTDVNLRWGALPSSGRLATLHAGTSIKYDAFSHTAGYVWLRQPRSDGTFAYLVSGKSKNGVRQNYYGKFS